MRREHIDRALGALLTVAVAYMLARSRALPLGYLHVLLVSLTSLAWPGLGMAILLIMHSYFAALNGGLMLLSAILLAPLAILSIRYWYIVPIWLLALTYTSTELSALVTIPLLFTALQYCDAVVAGYLAALYSLTLSLEASAGGGPLAVRGLLWVSGVQVVPTGNGLADAAAILGAWFSGNVLGGPNFLFQALVFTSAGILSSLLRQHLEKPWMAPAASSILVLVAFTVTSYRLSRQFEPYILLLPVAALAVGLLSYRLETMLTAKQDASSPAMSREGPANAAAPKPLEDALEGLVRALEGKAKSIIVFGPPGCGKTWVIRQALARLNLRPGLDVQVLDDGAPLGRPAGPEKLVIEVHDPEKLGQVASMMKAEVLVFVPPPGIEERRWMLRERLGGRLPEALVNEVACKTANHSLRDLAWLCEKMLEALDLGFPPEAAVRMARLQVKPQLTDELLARIDGALNDFGGLVLRPYPHGEKV